MSDRTLRISRRKLLRLTGVAPLVALMAAGATPAQVASAMAGLPDPVPDDLLKEANRQGLNPDPTLFKVVARILWEFLDAGAAAGKVAMPGGDTLAKLAMDAYKQPSASGDPCGNLITRSIPHWKTDAPAEWDWIQTATLGCAYLCGFYAAEAAKSANPQKTLIDQASFKSGYERTQTQMKATFDRFLQQKPEEREPVKGLAAGCG